MEFACFDQRFLALTILGFFRGVGQGMGVEQNGAFQPLRHAPQHLKRNVTAHGMSCQPSFFNATLVQNACDHLCIEFHGVDAMSFGIGRCGIRQAVTGQIERDDAEMIFKYIDQFVENVHRLEVPMEEHQTGLEMPGQAFIFRIPDMDGYTRRNRKEFHIPSCPA